MSNIEKVLVGLAMMSISITGAWAEMPKELKGSWILHASATETHMKTSPKWKAEHAKYLPTVMKRMSKVLFEFGDNAIVASTGSKQQTLPVMLKESSRTKYVFEGRVREKSVTMTVSFVDDRTINIRSSATDDMDYYLWKRGSLTNKAAADDKSLAMELMKKSLEEFSDKTDAGDGE